jgi:N-acetylglucosaminyldiphosphoundecaprenol N-acetyl-beta-D-mannosaminyltransferase
MFDTVHVGGLPIAVLSNEETVDLFEKWIAQHKAGQSPKVSHSANGEVLARVHSNPQFKADLCAADMINADGMPLVTASKLLTSKPLPERVVTTDLFQYAIRRAVKNNISFYLLGADEQEITKATQNLRQEFPTLNIVGYHHGYINEGNYQNLVADTNEKQPNIVWLGMGVPREQSFALKLKQDLTHVAVIKSCGGLYNYISGLRSRAPLWMQKYALEWLYRLYLEPKRLGWRYLTTNPIAAWHLLTKTNG